MARRPSAQRWRETRRPQGLSRLLSILDLREEISRRRLAALSRRGHLSSPLLRPNEREPTGTSRFRYDTVDIQPTRQRSRERGRYSGSTRETNRELTLSQHVPVRTTVEYMSSSSNTDRITNDTSADRIRRINSVGEIGWNGVLVRRSSMGETEDIAIERRTQRTIVDYGENFDIFQPDESFEREVELVGRSATSSVSAKTVRASSIRLESSVQHGDSLNVKNAGVNPQDSERVQIFDHGFRHQADRKRHSSWEAAVYPHSRPDSEFSVTAWPTEYCRGEQEQTRASTALKETPLRNLREKIQRKRNLEPAVDRRNWYIGRTPRSGNRASPEVGEDAYGNNSTTDCDPSTEDRSCKSSESRRRRRALSPRANETQYKRQKIEDRGQSKCHMDYTDRGNNRREKTNTHPRREQYVSPVKEFYDYVASDANKTSDETATYLANKLDQLGHYFRDNASFHRIQIVLKIVDRISGSTCKQSVERVMLYLSKNGFFTSSKLEKELMALRVGDADVTEDKCAFLQLLLRDMNHVLKSKIQAGCLDLDCGIIRCSDGVRNIPCLRNNVGIPGRLTEDLHKFEESMDQFQKMREAKRSIADNVPGTSNQDHEPPLDRGSLDITQANILPTAAELTPNRAIVPLVNMQSCRSFLNENHYLKSIFSLYREDFVRPLISSICIYRKTYEEEGSPPSCIRGLKMYTDVTVKDSKCSNMDGIVYTVCFDTKPFKSLRWASSKRLKYGSLVCLSSDNFNEVICATVANRKPEDLKEGQLDLLFLSGPHVDSYDEKNFVMIESDAFYPAYSFTLEGLKTLGQRIVELEQPLPLFRYYVHGESDPKPPAYLISENADEQIKFDFTCLLCPTDAIVSPDVSSVPSFKAVPVLDETAWPDARRLRLNESQYEGLKSMVTQELPLIQGPPGTGKTFMGWKCLELLLNNMKVWNDGLFYSAPILVVCYTNRALDQFLERAMKFPCIANLPDTALVRVGSRCLLECLEKHNLATLRRNHRNNASRTANSRLRERGLSHDQVQANINRYYSGILHEDFLRNKGVISSMQYSSLVEMINMQGNDSAILEWLNIRPLSDRGIFSNNRSMNQESVDDYLDLRDEDDIHRQDIWDDDDIPCVEDTEMVFQSEEKGMFALEFESMGADQYSGIDHTDRTVQQGPTRDEEMVMWRCELASAVSSPDALSEDDGKERRHLWPMELEQRWRLYRTWVKMLCKPKIEELTEIKENYNNCSKIYKEARRVGDQTILREAKLIGMTTTGAARNLDAIRAVGPKVVIVEEAAEVPESHVVTALGSSCQHLILIGDHQQLRPSYNDYTLAREHGIDLSLFERLTRNGQNPARLRVQHRMRPEISRLLVPHIYKELQDHESVMTQPNILGIASNVYFIDHHELERQETHSTSHDNPHEAKFVLSLASYLLKQGYRPRQITILTTYSGQYFLLSRLYRDMRELERGIKIATVDNFQGEKMILSCCLSCEAIDVTK